VCVCARACGCVCVKRGFILNSFFVTEFCFEVCIMHNLCACCTDLNKMLYMSNRIYCCFDRFVLNYCEGYTLYDDDYHCCLQRFPVQNIRRRASTPYRIPGDSVCITCDIISISTPKKCCDLLTTFLQ